MKTKRLSETLPVRLQADVDRRLRLIAQKTGLTKSDALRMAINHGLPQLEQGRVHITQGAA